MNCGRIGEMLGFQADGAVFSVMRAALAVRNICATGRVNLHAGLIGQRLHHSAALGIIQPRGKAHRFAFAQYEVMVITAGKRHLRTTVRRVKAVA